MKASLVAHDYRALSKKLELKVVKYGYVKGYPKRLATQIGLLKILGARQYRFYFIYLIILRELNSKIPNIIHFTN
jgi:hypothetical protein